MLRMSVLLLVLGAFTSAFAQDCPRIIVSGGDGEGVPAPGEPIPYVVTIDPPEKAVGLSYLWSVSTANGPVGMVRGQGTARIEVPYTHNGATATVKVIGLPAGCPNEASDMVAVHPPEIKCPKILVYGPAGTTVPGVPLIFNADIKLFDHETTKLVWTVSGGTILKGQGTRQIEVGSVSDGSNVTATLTVEGIPSGCANTASETAGVAICRLPITLDEWGNSSWQDEKARLSYLASRLVQEPGSIAIVLFTYPTKVTRATIQARSKRIHDYLTIRWKISSEAIRLVYGEGDKIGTRIYLWPKTTDLPPEGVDLDEFRPKGRQKARSSETKR